MFLRVGPKKPKIGLKRSEALGRDLGAIHTPPFVLDPTRRDIVSRYRKPSDGYPIKTRTQKPPPVKGPNIRSRQGRMNLEKSPDLPLSMFCSPRALGGSKK